MAVLKAVLLALHKSAQLGRQDFLVVFCNRRLTYCSNLVLPNSEDARAQAIPEYVTDQPDPAIYSRGVNGIGPHITEVRCLGATFLVDLCDLSLSLGYLSFGICQQADLRIGLGTLDGILNAPRVSLALSLRDL